MKCHKTKNPYYPSNSVFITILFRLVMTQRVIHKHQLVKNRLLGEFTLNEIMARNGVKTINMKKCEAEKSGSSSHQWYFYDMHSWNLTGNRYDHNTTTTHFSWTTHTHTLTSSFFLNTSKNVVMSNMKQEEKKSECNGKLLQHFFPNPTFFETA